MKERPESEKPSTKPLIPSLEPQISEFVEETEKLEEFFSIEVNEPDLFRTYRRPKYIEGPEHQFGGVKLNPFWNAARHEARHFIHNRVIESVAFSNPGGIESFYENEMPEEWKISGKVDRYTAGQELFFINGEYDIQPEIFASGKNAIIPEEGLKKNLAGLKTEPLTTDNLEEYPEDDRRKAMLYNSRIENSIDEFLELLDSYGID